jgi:hypothetical protein
VSNYITKFLIKTNETQFIPKYELDPFMMIVQSIERTLIDKLFRLLNDLKPNLEPLIQSLDAKLSLVQSDHSPRLERGINESGLIRPDYGKPFTGYYFDSLHVTVKTQPVTKKQTIVFLESYLEGLIIAYFVQHPSVASNWENSFRNPNRSRIATTSSPSSIINFPSIEIDVG